MSKVKVKRQSVSLDMTAMCDMAFLLLTFFMLTSKFKEDDALAIDTPSSVSTTVIPDTDMMLIEIDKEGKVIFGVDRQRTRVEMLKLMGDKYKQKFNEDELNLFARITNFGVPIGQMKQYLALDRSKRNKYMPGIPTDSTNNELKDWIYSARRANQNAYSKAMKIAIKGDQDSKSPIIRRVIATLQDQEINKFNFITDLEEQPADAVRRRNTAPTHK